MNILQEERLKILRQAVIGCGGKILAEIPLPDGTTTRLKFWVPDYNQLAAVVKAMIPNEDLITRHPRDQNEM